MEAEAGMRKRLVVVTKVKEEKIHKTKTGVRRRRAEETEKKIQKKRVKRRR